MDYVLDFQGINDLKEIHGMLADVFEFPKYYGKNLDGFYDLMSSRINDMKIIVRNSQKEDERLNEYLNQLKAVLLDLENECENILVEIES
jgi:RNAse (barnase) inhibitor barstar